MKWSAREASRAQADPGLVTHLTPRSHLPPHHCSGLGQDEGQVGDADVRRPPQSGVTRACPEGCVGQRPVQGREGVPGRGMAGSPRGTQSPKPAMKQESAGHGEGRQPVWVSKEHPEGQPPPPPATGGIGLGVPKAMEVALAPGSQRGPEALCLSRTHWAHGARHSAPRHLPSALGRMQDKGLSWDLIPELPSGTLSFPPSTSWGSLHSPGDLMSTDRVTRCEHPRTRCTVSTEQLL